MLLIQFVLGGCQHIMEMCRNYYRHNYYRHGCIFTTVGKILDFGATMERVTGLLQIML